MTNEIKEILNNIKIVIDERHYRATCDIDYEDCKILLDYITNLQEENERLNNIINKAIEYLESYNTDFKNCRFGEAPISLRELGDLLEILKGE